MKKQFYLLQCIAVSAAFLISGCATILTPQKGSVTLATEPSGAEVYDENEKKVGVTPLDLKTISKTARVLKIKKEGYEDAGVVVNRKTNNGMMFLDALFLCIPCPVDLSTGALHTIQPFDGTFMMRKKLKEHDKNLMVAIGKGSMDMNNSKEIGRINGSKKTFDDKGITRTIGYAEDIDGPIVESMKDSYFDAGTVAAMDNDKGGITKPKVILTPVVRDLYFNLKGKTFNAYKGPCSISVDWKIYKVNNRDKLLATIPLKTSVYRFSGNSAPLLDFMIAESARDLMGIDTLYDYISNLEKEYMEESKGSVFKIQAPPSPNYKTPKEVLKGSVAGVVTIESKDGFGSGVIISKDGYVITNYHVVEGEKRVKIKLNAEVKLNADIVKTNKDYDLALLKLEASDLKALPFGDSEKAEVGDDVWAIGTPMEKSLGQTITKGIISGFREYNSVKFIQSDVSINPGNSGGPLINEKGEIIAITTMKISGKGIEGLGFCIPSNSVIEFLNLQFDK